MLTQFETLNKIGRIGIILAVIIAGMSADMICTHAVIYCNFMSLVNNVLADCKFEIIVIVVRCKVHVYLPFIPLHYLINSYIYFCCKLRHV